MSKVYGCVKRTDGTIIPGKDFLDRYREKVLSYWQGRKEQPEKYEEFKNKYKAYRNALKRGINLGCKDVTEEGIKDVAIRYFAGELEPFTHSLFEKLAPVEELWKKYGRHIVKQGDAELMDGNFNIVMIDPPYGADVNYGELSEFFMAWTGETIKKIFPQWETDVKKLRGLAAECDFNTKMKNIFKNTKKCLVAGGLLFLFFASKRELVWSQLQEAVTDAGFKLTQFWPITTEPKSGFKKGNRYSITMLLIFRHAEEVESSEFSYAEKIKELEQDGSMEMFTEADLKNIEFASRF